MEDFPDEFVLRFLKVKPCKYGENPQNKAAVYRVILEKDWGPNGVRGMLEWEQLAGGDLSFNNYLDAGKAFDILEGFDDKPTVATIKHGHISGLARAPGLCEAYELAHKCDPQADLGNITVVNRMVTPEEARLIGKMRENPDTVYTEILIAPDYEPEAVGILQAKQKRKMQVLKATGRSEMEFDIKLVQGVGLVQTPEDYSKRLDRSKLTYPTRRRPDPDTEEKLLEAWEIVRKVESNGIVVGDGRVKDGEVEAFWTYGVGSFRKRVGAMDIALRNAGGRAEGAVLASDGHFPFPDNIEKAWEYGIVAIIYPPGSRNDQKCIDLCDKYEIPVIFSNTRAFRH